MPLHYDFNNYFRRGIYTDDKKHYLCEMNKKCNYEDSVFRAIGTFC